ncbi:unnamed protein product [Sphagnum balticum]
MTQHKETIDPLHPVKDDFLENPYPIFDQMRSLSPIYWGSKSKQWLVTGYDLAAEITKDLRFEKRLERWNQLNPITKMLPGPAHLIRTRQHWMLNENPPEHTQLRSLVNKAFSPRMVQQMKQHIQDIANDLTDKHKAAGKMEFIADFAFLLPITVIAEMLGIPMQDHAKFREWSHHVTETAEDALNPVLLHRGNKAHDELVDYLKPLVDERRKAPKDDLISALINAEENGVSLDETALLGQIVLMLVAGHETTVNLIGNGLLALLKHPDQFQLLKDDPTLIDSTVEECLRFDSPVQTVKRLAGADMEFHGNKIRKGDMLVLFLGACNRDPAIFKDPHSFNISRKENKHLAFSSGIHHCLGASLARLEGQIALRTIIEKLPQIKLSGQELVHKRPFNLRGVRELHVTF